MLFDALVSCFDSLRALLVLVACLLCAVVLVVCVRAQTLVFFLQRELGLGSWLSCLLVCPAF